MKRKVIVVGIIILLMIVGLSGCEEQLNDDNSNEGNIKQKFIGSWISNQGWYNYTITFSADDTYESQGHIWGNGVFEIANEQLTLKMSNSNMEFTFDFSFTNNEQNLTFTYESGDSLEFTKQ